MAAVASALPAPRDGMRDGRRAHLVFLALSLPVLAVLGWGVHLEHPRILALWDELLPWWGALAFVSLFDLASPGGRRLSASLPILNAAALVFSPPIAGLLAFSGGFDRRELARQVSLARAIFNRSEQAAMTMIVSVAGRAVLSHVVGPLALPLASLVVLGAGTTANYLVVTGAVSAAYGQPFLGVLADMRIGRPLDFALTWLGWGVIGFLLALAYDSLHAYGLVILALLALMGRQALLASQTAVFSERRADEQRGAFEALSRRIHDERRDERLRVASQLHDEILQPLYQVSLHSHVVRRDLDGGRLLELPEDLRTLSRACEEASENVRQAIGSLRESPVGLRGLDDALRNLVRDMAERSSTELVASIDCRDVPPDVQRIAYEVCREALTNALHHARAARIEVMVCQDDDALRISVVDDGIGFHPSTARQGHFGMLIMRERAESIGGMMLVDSEPSRGTTVAIRLPLSGTLP